MTKGRNRKGYAVKLLSACEDILKRHGPLTTVILLQYLRSEHGIDVTTNELPAMIRHYGNGRITKEKKRFNYPPYGGRVVNVYRVVDKYE